MKAHQLILPLCGLAIGLTGCGVTLDVPGDARIECSDTSDCPEGYQCRTNVGYCATFDASETGPEISNIAVSRERVGPGQTVSVSFTVNEAAAELPRVLFHWAGDETRSLTSTRVDGNGYEFIYDVQGPAAEPTGIASMTISLIGLDGLPGFAEIPQAVEFDFSPPEIVVGTTSVELVPSLTNPLRVEGVSEVRDQTTIRLTFAVSELLIADPSVHTSAPEELTFVRIGGDGNTYVFEHTLDDQSHPEQIYTIEVDATDMQNNNALLPLPDGGFEIDLTPPTAPDVDSPDLVIYSRAPWGVGGEAPEYSVVGADNSVDDETVWVAVFDDSGINPLGRGPTNSNRGFDPIVLNPADRSTVFVVALDGAGNTSMPVAVRDVSWTATLAGKVSGSTQENPHNLIALRSVLNSVEQEPSAILSLESSEIDAVAHPDGVAHSFPSKISTAWDLYGVRDEHPMHRQLTAMAYDSARGRAMLFGGKTQFVQCNNSGSVMCHDTWAWDGREWRESVVVGARPTARNAHSMAFDSGRGRVVLFGGLGHSSDCAGSGNNHCADTWEWDGERWLDVTPPGPSPSPRGFAAMAYDDLRRQVILYGGSFCSTEAGIDVIYCMPATPEIYDDTWAWDGESWTELQPVGSTPGARHAAAMVADTARSRLILFGGVGEEESDCNGSGMEKCQDTWEWTGSEWNDISPLSSPPPRSKLAMAYDRTRDVVVMAGGDITGPNDEHQVWEFDGTNWSIVTDEALYEPMDDDREAHSMVYDSRREETLLFGGWEFGDSANDETWVWNPPRWLEVGPSDLDQMPPPRRSPGFVYDPAHRVTLLHGGQAEFNLNGGCNDGFSCNDTWIWNGRRWRQSYNGPQRRYGHGMVYDSTRQRVVLFGGGTLDGSQNTFDDTLVWADSPWTAIATSGARPSARIHMGMAYDSVRDRVILFGGGRDQATTSCDAFGSPMCSDTWELGPLGRTCGGQPTCWRAVATLARPSARACHNMAYDPSRRRVVLFGGVDQLNYSITHRCEIADGNGLGDTWEWDGAGWELVSEEGDGPSPRWSAGMTYDEARGRVVLYGGMRSLPPPAEMFKEPLGDLWEWDGTKWVELPPPINMPPRATHAMTYDSQREELIVAFGSGEGLYGVLDGVVDAPSLGRARPTALLTIDWTAADALSSDLRALEVSAVMGGSGSRAGTPWPGAELLMWNAHDGRWDGIGATSTGACAATSCESLEVATPSSAQAQRFTNDQGFYLLLRAAAPVGRSASLGVLDLDYVEVTARYRHDHNSVCGDGIRVVGDEQCDNGIANSDVTPDACRTDCTTARCGDRIVDSNEECDDGDPFNDGNGCGADCTFS